MLLGLLILATGVAIAIWQIYVLASGNAKFGGYIVPIILLVIATAMIYFGLMEMGSSSVYGGRRRR